jgi:hypothetical protein
MRTATTARRIPAIKAGVTETPEVGSTRSMARAPAIWPETPMTVNSRIPR